MLTQPITLITGVPGAGKTLRAIYEGLELQKDGREVFAFGIDGLDPDLIESLPEDWDITKWQELPDGAVLIVDEAHKYFPVRTKDKVPDWMSKLTEIRHYGKNLILITQDPRNIDAFVRRLVGEHLHLTRKAGLKGALVRTFEGVADNPDDYHAKKNASAVAWLYPKKLFKVYKSATMHVMKPKLPLKFIFFAVLLLVLLFIAVPLIVSTYKKSVGRMGVNEVAEASSVETKSQKNAFAFSSDSSKRVYHTSEDYVKAHTPLVEVAPWSAPIYHDSPVVNVPRIFCYAYGYENTPQRVCKCKTEQLTTIENIPPIVCEKVIKDGVYDPYHNFNEWGSQEASVHATDAPVSQNSFYIPSADKDISASSLYVEE